MKLRLDVPKFRFPSITNCIIAVKIEPITVVTTHKERGAGKLTIVAACSCPKNVKLKLKLKPMQD